MSSNGKKRSGAGRPIEKNPLSVRVMTRLTAEQVDSVKKEAEKDGVKVATWIRDAVEKKLRGIDR